MANYHEQYIPALRKTVRFCNDCGEYVYPEWKSEGKIEYNVCSNPFCPEQIDMTEVQDSGRKVLKISYCDFAMDTTFSDMKDYVKSLLKSNGFDLSKEITETRNGEEITYIQWEDK